VFKKENSISTPFVLSLTQILLRPLQYHRSHCFIVKVKHTGVEVTHYLAAEDEKMFSQWTLHIKNSILGWHPERAQRVPKPHSLTVSNKDISWKNKLLSKVVTTSIAKTLIQQFVSPDAILLIDLIGKSLRKYYKDKPQLAERFEQVMLQTGLDAAFMISDKVITKENLVSLRDPIFNLWSESLDMLELSFYFDAEQLTAAVVGLSDALDLYLLPFLSTKEKRDQVTDFRPVLGNKDAILAFYTSDEFSAERDEMHTILRRVWDRNFASVKQ
jgi:hypothetical protein